MVFFSNEYVTFYSRSRGLDSDGPDSVLDSDGPVLVLDSDSDLPDSTTSLLGSKAFPGSNLKFLPAGYRLGIVLRSPNT